MTLVLSMRQLRSVVDDLQVASGRYQTIKIMPGGNGDGCIAYLTRRQAKQLRHLYGV
jgi:hypothetical protein